MPRLRDVGEIEALRRLIAARGAARGVVVGPGDDAAVLAPTAGWELVVTTDAMVEGRHFLPGWLPPAGRGARLATANLSDLAAMAAEPRWALLSIGLRGEHELESLLEFQRGVAETLAGPGAAIVGGNLTAVEGPEWYDLTLIGEVPSGAAWTRAGARPGDAIAVTGFPGRAAAGLALVGRLGEAAHAAEWLPLVEAWTAPRARTSLARALAATGAVHAAIDLSDGLAGDLDHLCEASGVGAVVDMGALPSDPLIERAAATLGVAAAELRSGPSDDYELILALDPGRRAEVEEVARGARVPLAFVGQVVGGAGVSWGGAPPRRAAGFDHFAD